MDKTGEGHSRRRCVICQRYFTPDPRQGERQKCCGDARCRREYKKLWRQEKYENSKAFRRKEKIRVGRWR